MQSSEYPPEVVEEAKRWPLSVKHLWGIWREFPDDDLRQIVVKAEAFGEWPIRHFAAIEQRARDQRRLERILSGEVADRIAAVVPTNPKGSWRDTLPRPRRR